MSNFHLTVNLLIIFITVLVSVYAFDKPNVKYGWMFNPVEIDRGQYHRFVTSGFIHADYMHLFFNMFTLYNFGPLIENLFIGKYGVQFGRASYLIFYIVAVIVANIPSFFKHRGNQRYNALGASGAVSAVLFGAILFFPTGVLGVFFIPMPAFIFAILYLWYTYYEMRRGMSNIGHSAHWWGAMFGIVVMVAVFPDVVPRFISQIVNWRLEDFLNQLK